jgi:23S rRNA (pseudouridine1915-N3)-methyltransferase
LKYRVVAIGRLKRGFLAAGCAHFLERLSPYAKVEQLELKEGRGAARQVAEHEGSALLNAASGYLIALDERGTEHSSASWAVRITELENRSVGQVSFLLGGANGHSDALRAAVDEIWSLSKLTLPHELARLVLLEQLYRTETIRAGHPYHRDG